jgi:Methyltransferase domain
LTVPPPPPPRTPRKAARRGPGRGAAKPPRPAPAGLDSYTSGAPSPQEAVDVFRGEWSSALPAHLGVTAGRAELFDDPRIKTAIEWLGGDLAGRRVLELGPLEGGHSAMFAGAGAEVLSVESNARSFLKCLIVKELLGLRNVRFVRGDFVAHLEQSDERYDVLVASGVLYHMTDPLKVLGLMAGASDQLVVWTHYFDAEALSSAALEQQFSTEPETIEHHGATYTLHPRDYLSSALNWGGFCGGSESFARWMERDDILGELARLGFDEVVVAQDQRDHVNGPNVLVFARRS